MKSIRPAIIPLLGLITISLYTVYAILFESIFVEHTPLYVGLAVLLIAFGLFLTKSRFFGHAVVVLLFLWLVGVTNYLPIKLGLTLNFGEASITMQLGALLFLLAYYLLYRVRINKWLLNLIDVDPNSEKAKRASRKEIDKFKTTFRNYPAEKLQGIVAEKKLVSYAVFAAKELLTERVQDGAIG
jgi:hypothetical protein